MAVGSPEPASISSVRCSRAVSAGPCVRHGSRSISRSTEVSPCALVSASIVEVQPPLSRRTPVTGPIVSGRPGQGSV